MTAPIHAWDCSCGTRNAPTFARCRICGRTLASGTAIPLHPSPVQPPVAPVVQPVAPSLKPRRSPRIALALSALGVVLILLFVCVVIGSLTGPSAPAPIQGRIASAHVTITWLWSDNGTKGRIANDGQRPLQGLKIGLTRYEPDAPNGFITGDWNQTMQWATFGYNENRTYHHEGDLYGVVTTRDPVTFVDLDVRESIGFDLKDSYLAFPAPVHVYDATGQEIPTNQKLAPTQ